MSVRNRVFDILAQTYHIDLKTIDESQRLEMDLGGDSINNFDLHLRLERSFDIKIPDTTAEKFFTVGDVVMAVEYIIQP